MAQRLVCSHCQKKIVVRDELQGKKVRCPDCKQVLTVPVHQVQASEEVVVAVPVQPIGPSDGIREKRPSAPVRPLVQAAPDESDSWDEPKPKRKAARFQKAGTGRLRWVILGVGGVSILGVALFLAILYVNLSGPPEWANKPPAVAIPAPPPPEFEEIPGQLPAQMTAEIKERVKQATVHLKVTRTTALLAAGTGFFAAEPGLIFTNAHVVGLGSAGCSNPLKIEAVLYSGEANELTIDAHVLGVDHASDLAVLKVNLPPNRLPAPLAVASSRTMSEQQKVYVFGFPFEAGRNVTMTEASVSSFGKDADGNISQIKVNGNIRPGQSGSPVVDTRGVVVGVAVTIFADGQVNFAVPGERVHGLLRGRVQEVRFGEAYLKDNQTFLPLTVACLDPLSRLRHVKVEVWTGTAGASRPVSFKKPENKPGEGPRQVLAPDYQDGKAALELPLPALKDGQVLWVQPALIDGIGTTLWSAAAAYKPSGLPPLERKPAHLQFHFDSDPQRTLKIVSTYQIRSGQANEERVIRRHMEADVLETCQKDAQGALLQFQCGPYKLHQTSNGREFNPEPTAFKFVPGSVVKYKIARQGEWQNRHSPGLNANVPDQARRAFATMINQVANGFEKTCLSLPNRQVQPGETWPTKLPVLTADAEFSEVLNLMVTCTYEGCRTVQGHQQAVITMEGTIEGGIPMRTLGGKVTGTVYFAVEKGYVTQAKVKVDTDLTRGTFSATHLTEVTLMRVPGNTLGIVAVNPAAPGVQDRERGDRR